MQTILNFLIKHNHWFLFILLEGISFMLIVRFNNYQNAIFFTSANRVAGDVYAIFTDIDSYFGLRTENSSLLKHNRELLQEIAVLRGQLNEANNSKALLNDTTANRYKNNYNFYAANVVSNTLTRLNYFIVIDKGLEDGIGNEMGVFNSNGVVGVIYQASQHYSLVLPLLNNKSNTSCKIRNGNETSILQWDGKDKEFSYLVDLPRHSRFAIGDTIVTSGHSSIFPEDIPVGTIDDIEESIDGMFYKARVRLFADFSTLRTVFIVGRDGYKEQKELEKNIPKQ
ncbi:MAG: rod shape-determining protein MreC [Bacteroidaceae bacterium]|nr:rod shape-determining protein MreC [Bacteroidaceae bacterium]